MITWVYEHRYLKNTDTIYHREWSASGNGRNNRALLRSYNDQFSTYAYPIWPKLRYIPSVIFPTIYRLATILSKENCIHVIMLHFSDAIWYSRVILIERQSCLYTWQQRRKYITWCIWQKSIYEIVDLTDKMCLKDDVRFVWITRCSFSLWFFVYIIVFCQKVYSHICLCFENINLECYH